MQKIDAIIRFFLCVLIFWIPYSPAVVESCVITCLILWFIKKVILFDKRKVENLSFSLRIKAFIGSLKPSSSFLDRPIVFFIAACILSTLLSAFQGKSLHGFLTKTFEWFVVYFLVIEFIRTRKQLQMVLFLFIFSALVTSLDGIVQFYFTQCDLFMHRVISPSMGATAAFKTYNSLGAYLIFAVILVTSLFFIKKQEREYNIVLFFVFTVVSWCLVITLSRGSWIASFLGVSFLLFFYSQKWLMAILCGILIFIVCFFIFASPTTRTQLRTNSDNIRNTVKWRLGLWEDSLTMIKEKPLTGHGLNTYMTLFQKYRRKSENHDYDPTYAHNCYLQITAEVGVLGLAGFLWIIISLFQNIIRKFQEPLSERNDLKTLMMGLLSAILAFLLHMFVDTDLYSLQLSVLFWYIMGLAVSVYKLLNTSEIRDIKLT